MSHFLTRLGLVTLCSLFFGWVLAGDGPQPNATQVSASAPTALAPRFYGDAPPPEIDAAAYLVFDTATGERLAAHAPATPRPIASITKLATAAAAAELDDATQLTVRAADVATYGQAGDLEAGETYARRELQFPLLLESSNDAAATLARTGGDSFLDAMHQVASAAGMTDTRFADSSGLSAGNVATADDLARLLRHLVREHRTVLDITRLSRYLGPYGGWSNNNPVFDDPDYRGGKHGYTNAAGLTIAALFAEKFATGERTIGYIILDSDNLEGDVATLREYVATSVRYE